MFKKGDLIRNKLNGVEGIVYAFSAVYHHVSVIVGNITYCYPASECELITATISPGTGLKPAHDFKVGDRVRFRELPVCNGMVRHIREFDGWVQVDWDPPYEALLYHDPDNLILIVSNNTISYFKIKCECGAASLGYNTHSTWCALSDDKKDLTTTGISFKI